MKRWQAIIEQHHRIVIIDDSIVLVPQIGYLANDFDHTFTDRLTMESNRALTVDTFCDITGERVETQKYDCIWDYLGY